MVGHIRYANHVHDALLLAGLNGSELHAALVCYRAARGWGGLESKQVPWPMSAGLVVQSTTLKRSVAARALAGLRSKGIIVEHEPPRGPRPALYLFVERPDEWTVNLVSTERDIHGAGHKPPLSGTQVSTQRDSGVHSAGQSANENAVQQRKTAPPKTEDEKTEKTRSARAREGVSDALDEAGTERDVHGAGQSIDENVGSADAPPAPGRVAGDGEGDCDQLPPGVVLISGEIPADRKSWSDESPVVVEIWGERITLDGMYVEIPLWMLAEPKEQRKAPEPPKREPELPTLPDLLDALRAATDRWGERPGNRGERAVRAEQDIARPHMQSRLLVIAERADADGRRAEVLRLARRSADADAAPARYFLSCFDDGGTPKRKNNKRGRQRRRTYAHYRRS